MCNHIADNRQEVGTEYVSLCHREEIGCAVSQGVILKCNEDIGTFMLRSPKPGTAPSKDSLLLKSIFIFTYRQRQSTMKSCLKNLGASSCCIREKIQVPRVIVCLLPVTKGQLRLWL